MHLSSLSWKLVTNIYQPTKFGYYIIIKNSQPDFKYKLLKNYPEKKKMFNLLDIGKNSY